MKADDRLAERAVLCRAVEANTGVHDARVLAAFASVPREAFVPDDLADFAYQDRALPIGDGQTISQPSMIALMLAELNPRPAERALDVGTGSGYAAALLSRLCARVHSIEILPDLAAGARRALAAAGIDNVDVEVGDGTAGARAQLPFDVILVSAAARSMPHELVARLARGGRIAIPVGGEEGQHLMVGKRDATGEVHWERRTPCMFVPLVGSEEPRAAVPGRA